MSIVSRWAASGGLRIHYLDSTPPAASGLPLLFVPGMSDWAEEYHDILEWFAPRRALAVDLRGRGKSDAPETGYALEHHVEDLEAAIAAAGLERFHLATFSRGTGYALEYVVRNSGRVASLCIGDYRAEHIALPETWADAWMANRWRGRPMTERMQWHVAVQVGAEAEARAYWGLLEGLGIPLLVIRGGKEGRILTDAWAAEYRKHLPDVEMHTLAQSAHDLFRPDRYRYPELIRDFLRRHFPED